MSDNQRDSRHYGGVAEWSKAAVLKTVVPQGTVGSNPTTSAIVSATTRNILLDKVLRSVDIGANSPCVRSGSTWSTEYG